LTAVKRLALHRPQDQGDRIARCLPTLQGAIDMRIRPSLRLLALVAATSSWGLPATAAPDADAAMKLSKDSGCTKCHAIDKTKKGPSFQKTAAKYKGKSDAEAKLVDFITKSPKVKLEDGTEEEHKAVDTKDGAQVKNLAQWILAQ
jgi:cytochrome c